MGRATALTFAREGAAVVGCDVAVEPAEETVGLVRAAGGEMVSLQPCRLGDPAECAKLVELALRRAGRRPALEHLAMQTLKKSGHMLVHIGSIAIDLVNGWT